MTNLEVRILEMLLRVRQFGLTHYTGFPADSRGRELFEQVGGLIESVQTHSASQAQNMRAAKEKTSMKRAATAGVRDSMAAISRTARGMARNTPGLDNKFLMPNNEGVQGLLAAARSFVTDAEPLRDEFIRRGLPATFVEDLGARILLLEQSVDEQVSKSRARISATVSAADAVQKGRGAVRELDAIVRNVYAADAATRAEWESASHVERAPRRAELVAPAATPALATP